MSPSSTSSTPERQARELIDAGLDAAGWAVQSRAELNLAARRGVAVREYVMKGEHGYADYLLFVDEKPVGVVEAKPVGHTLSGVQIQARKYSEGLPDELSPPLRPLPFMYSSTGMETLFLNDLDPQPRSRRVFAFHRPETLAEWLQQKPLGEWVEGWRSRAELDARGLDLARPATLRARLRTMPDVHIPGLWPNKVEAITRLERSFYDDRPRALIQMATGSGKTKLAITAAYRLIKYAGARRILFLVDRSNLGEQADKEFQSYVAPDINRKFTELYNVQRLTSNTIAESAKVVITTIQRLYSMLCGQAELDPGLEEHSAYEAGDDPRQLIQDFRTGFWPRIAVTVDMIATGTDIKPIEIVMFMRSVRSRLLFDQMKGRGVRVIDQHELRAVTPDATAKDHFVIVDCVGVCDAAMHDPRPLERNPTIALSKLLEHVASGGTNEDYLSSLASRLARLDQQCGGDERAQIERVSGGTTLADLTQAIFKAIAPEKQEEAARRELGIAEDADPTPQQVQQVAERLSKQAVRPLATNPALRRLLLEIKRTVEQVIDEVSTDEVIEAGKSADAKAKAKGLVASFEQYLEEHKDAIDALQFFYSQPHGQRLRYKDIKDLAAAIKAPPRQWTPDKLWRAYETVAKDRVRAASGERLLTDIVSLVRFALHRDTELKPFADQGKLVDQDPTDEPASVLLERIRAEREAERPAARARRPAKRTRRVA